MGKSREPQIILKTDQRNVIPEMSQEGKFTAKSSSWMRTGSSLRTTSARVAVKNGRCVMTHLPAGPAPEPPPVEQYFPTE